MSATLVNIQSPKLRAHIEAIGDDDASNIRIPEDKLAIIRVEEDENQEFEDFVERRKQGEDIRLFVKGPCNLFTFDVRDDETEGEK